MREREGERGRGREKKVRERDRGGDTAERRARQIMWAQIANACFVDVLENMFWGRSLHHFVMWNCVYERMSVLENML